MSDEAAAPIVRMLGRAAHADVCLRMKAFTEARDDSSADEIWMAEHEPVFTQGLGGRAEHVRDAGGIPVVATNRGGQVTYHGPGQVVAYPLVDLRRLGIYVKEYVYRLEEALMRTLAADGVVGHRVVDAPGVYVRRCDPFGHVALHRPAGFEGLAKIAALGVKVTRHRTYHGAALNVAMNLEPFGRIDPCGHRGLETVDLATLGVHRKTSDVAVRLAVELSRLLRR